MTAAKKKASDYPIRTVPVDMYKCGYCGKFDHDKGICGYGVRVPPEGGHLLPTDVACSRIFEFFVGGSFAG